MQPVITTAVVHSELQGMVCVTLYEFNIIFPLDLPLPPRVFGLTVEDFIYSFHHLFMKKKRSFFLLGRDPFKFDTVTQCKRQ